MKKIAICFIVLAVLGSATTYGILLEQRGWPMSEEEVRYEVGYANYCMFNADCTVAPGNCPFLPEPVNVAETHRVAGLYYRYQTWKGACTFDVLEMRDLSRLSCVKNKCVAALKGK